MPKAKKKKPAKARTAMKKPARKAAKKKAAAKKPVRKKAAPKKKAAARPKVKAKVKARAKAKPKTRAASRAATTSAPVKPGVGRRPDRDDHAGVRIAPTAPERITPGPKPAPDPLTMPIAISSDHPIASPNLRPAPLFERELVPHDNEE